MYGPPIGGNRLVGLEVVVVVDNSVEDDADAVVGAGVTSKRGSDATVLVDSVRGVDDVNSTDGAKVVVLAPNKVSDDSAAGEGGKSVSNSGFIIGLVKSNIPIDTELADP